MAYRDFLDKDGNHWKVWDVIPDESIFVPRRSTPRSSPRVSDPKGQARSEVTPARTRGWLAFQSSGENRRLSPIPEGWENASESELASYLQKASQVQNRYRA